MSSNQRSTPSSFPSVYQTCCADEIYLILLAGVCDPDSILSLLRGTPHLVDLIFELATNEAWWRKCVRLPNCAVDRRVFDEFYEKGRIWHREKSVDDSDKLIFASELDTGCEGQGCRFFEAFVTK